MLSWGRAPPMVRTPTKKPRRPAIHFAAALCLAAAPPAAALIRTSVPTSHGDALVLMSEFVAPEVLIVALHSHIRDGAYELENWVTGRPPLDSFSGSHEYPYQAESSDREALLEDGKVMVIFPEGRQGLYAKYWAGAPYCSWGETFCCFDFLPCASEDVGFVRDLVQRALEVFPSLDRGRVYAHGYSMGGFLSYRLACEAADLFAGVVVASAGGPHLIPRRCSPSRPVHLLHTLGSEDFVYKNDTSVQVWLDMSDRLGCSGANSQVGEADLQVCSLDKSLYGEMYPRERLSGGDPEGCDPSVINRETQFWQRESCPKGGSATAWSVRGGGNANAWRKEQLATLLGWMSAARRSMPGATLIGFGEAEETVSEVSEASLLQSPKPVVLRSGGRQGKGAGGASASPLHLTSA